VARGGGGQPSRARSHKSAQKVYESIGSPPESQPCTPPALSQQRGSELGNTTAVL